ncbi:ATP synthase mitochondrial F1 complex assembly factor 2 [Sergentomyia squamirostris]
MNFVLRRYLINLQQCRSYATVKKFFKSATLQTSNGKYEIALDQKKLKTPGGKIFQVTSEPLANAVAAEWNLQRENIDRSTMHLTSLLNTAQDNPNGLTKIDLTNYLVNYLPTDTVLFQSEKEDELASVQANEWDPVILWFNKQFQADLRKSNDLSSPQLSATTRMNVSKYLLSHDESSLHAITFSVDSLKSVILTLAILHRMLSTEKAVYLSRLEEEFQLGFWGRVEWAHDSSQQELQSRVSAAILLVHLTSTTTSLKIKSAAQ